MVITVHQLCCDGPGCTAAYQAKFEEIQSIVRLRRGAKATGWTRRAGQDLCDTCTTKTAPASRS